MNQQKIIEKLEGVIATLSDYWEDDAKTMVAVLKEALASLREDSGEPVAWMRPSDRAFMYPEDKAEHGQLYPDYSIPLYTHPPRPDLDRVMEAVKDWEEYDTRIEHGGAGENEYLDIAGFYLFWSDLRARLSTIITPKE